MTKEIICAGFGGQGVLTAGLILAEAGFRQGMQLTWYPSYGSEMRGGTANCNVKFSDEEIGNPYCSELDVLLAMNEPSIDRFEQMLKPGGILIYNSDMVNPDRKYREDIRAVGVAANTCARNVNNPKGANIAALGVLARETGIFTPDDLRDAVCAFFEKKGKGKFNDKNKAVFDEGCKAQE